MEYLLLALASAAAGYAIGYFRGRKNPSKSGAAGPDRDAPPPNRH